MYVDEAGDNKADQYLILATLICHEGEWKTIESEIKELKTAYFQKPDMNLKRIRRKNHDPEKLFESLSKDEQIHLAEDIKRIMTKKCCIYMSSVIDKKKMGSENIEKYLGLAYSFLLERYHYLLCEKSELGIVIMDQSDNVAVNRLRDTHRKIMDGGINTYTHKNGIKVPKVLKPSTILENLFFEDDDDSNHLQLTDFVASSVYLKFNRGYEKYFKNIEGNFRCSSEGEIMGYGLKIFPPSESKTADDEGPEIFQCPQCLEPVHGGYDYCPNCGEDFQV